MASREAHAVVGHLLRLSERQELSRAQDAFLGALLAELERRWRESEPLTRCHCRMCVPADPMGLRPAETR